MVMLKPSRPSRAGQDAKPRTPIAKRTSPGFDPEEIRRIVEDAKEKGLLLDPGQAREIEKKGEEAARLGLLRTLWMEVTPAKAREWLENNFRNRPIKEDVVKAYARDMAVGTWVSTHQGIAFNDKDELIDGQHRLSAIVLCKVTVRMMVTFGMPSKIEGKEMTPMDAVDRGATRSVADQLTIQHGFKNGSITAAICKGISNLCCSERTRRLSVGQTLDIYRLFENEIQWVIVHRSKANGLRSAGVVTAFAFALATTPEFVNGSSPISLMFERLVGGEPLDLGTPIAQLREFLTSDESKLLLRIHDRAIAELTLEAIRLELSGSRVPKLEINEAGANLFRAALAPKVRKIAAMFELPK